MNRFFFLTPIILLWFQSVNLSAQELVYESGGDLLPELASFNVSFYDLDVALNPTDSTVSGHVDIYFEMVQPNNRIALALDPRLNIHSVERLQHAEKSIVSIDRNDSSRTFFVNFPETLQPYTTHVIRVTYEGKPLVALNPPWDGGMVWDRTPSGEPWVGVASQTIGPWVWWPNKDHPSDKADSVAINLSMPENLVVASNGKLRNEVDLGNGMKRWEWFVSTPINNYNVTLNAAPYEIIKESYESVSGDEMEIIFWVLPEFIEEGKKLFPQFVDQMQFLEELLGPYPFRQDKYGVAHAPYLGMEHQTLIAYGAGFKNGALFGDATSYDDLHQHELAHEWWGNLVTAWDWRDFWLHESFGTYMQALHEEHISGSEGYNNVMDVLRSRISESSTLAVAPRESMTTLEITQGSRGGNVYYKGAWFLHTLRYVIGDDHFFELLHRFAYPSEIKMDGNQTRFATTDDFLYLAEEISKMDLNWLFDIYIRSAELPVLHATRRGGIVTMEWRVPDNRSFPMPIEVKVGDQTVSLVPENNRISFEVDDRIEIEADPYNRILKLFELNNVQQ